MSRPESFDRYWAGLVAEVDRTDPAPVLTETPIRSTPFSTAYDLRLTSIGPYRIFGFLSVPNGTGPFPALLNTPRYGSVNNPPHWDDRQRYVVLTLMHRGQRLADQPWAAAYPGLLTEGIQDPATWIYRDIVADCLTGARFLASHPAVDRSRVAVAGDDLALVTASMLGEVNAVVARDLLFYRLMEARTRTSAYPVEEINDELRLHPGTEARIERSVELLDPRNHVGQLQGKVLLVQGDAGAIGGPEWLDPLAEAIGPRAERYPVTHEGGTDHDAIDAWLAAAQGVQPLPRLWPAAMS